MPEAAKPTFQRASASVHKLPPPAKAVSDALPADKRDDLQALLKAEKGASLHKGAMWGGLAGLLLGMALNIISNTSLIDQVGSIWTSRMISEKIAPDGR
jgi:hypothetical protein